MARWTTASEVTKAFGVGEEKLVRFAGRGNLASRVENGVRLFDLEGVKRLFAPRKGAALPELTWAEYAALRSG